MRRILLVLLFCGIFVPVANAQLSEGGWPRSSSALVSEWLPRTSMPWVSNTLLLWEAESRWIDQSAKNFEFAHTFEVDFSPTNHGVWHTTLDGWHVWQMRIHSHDAFSINLILEQFQPTTGDRIFVYTPDLVHILGAFTSNNIYDGHVLALSPLPGDEVIVHYETRQRIGQRVPFVIKSINHDFVDILKINAERRPLGTVAGDCIPDVNCAEANRWREVQNSVCRIMIAGRELCTGTLMNNTAADGKPYVLTAGHCIGSESLAKSSLFHFNYESPYCGSLDGDISHSISGSSLRAYSDSLDFALVELSALPPPPFRPYYAGWNRSVQLLDTVAAIHHSQGDIKKISVANSRPLVSNFGSAPLYTPNGFWRISQWNAGATERGASGSPLLDRTGLLVGTLTGGSSSCSNPINDYFARFNQAWAFSQTASKNLRTWLDPLNQNPLMLAGRPLYQGEDYCKTFTNLKSEDVHQVAGIPHSVGAGYYTGSNNLGITHVAEKFKLPTRASLHSISIGIAQIVHQSGSPNSVIDIEIYDYNLGQPELVHRQSIALSNLIQQAMNLVEFDKIIEPADSFLISVGFSRLSVVDTLVLYQSLREPQSVNTLYLKQNGVYVSFNSLHDGNLTGSLVAELIACNLTYKTSDSLLVEVPEGFLVFPNPVSGRKVTVVAETLLANAEVALYNLNAQRVLLGVEFMYPNQLELDLSGNVPGFYVLRLQVGGRFHTTKIIYNGQ